MNKRTKEMIDKYFEDHGLEEVIEKKDARILFNKEIDENGVSLTEIAVHEFKIGHRESWPMYLYKKFISDMGNCEKGWDEMCIVSILSYFLLNYNYNQKTKENLLQQLSKIKECRYQIGFHLARANNYFD